MFSFELRSVCSGCCFIEASTETTAVWTGLPSGARVMCFLAVVEAAGGSSGWTADAE